MQQDLICVPTDFKFLVIPMFLKIIIFYIKKGIAITRIYDILN